MFETCLGHLWEVLWKFGEGLGWEVLGTCLGDVGEFVDLCLESLGTCLEDLYDKLMMFYNSA